MKTYLSLEQGFKVQGNAFCLTLGFICALELNALPYRKMFFLSLGE